MDRYHNRLGRNPVRLVLDHLVRDLNRALGLFQGMEPLEEIWAPQVEVRRLQPLPG